MVGYVKKVIKGADPENRNGMAEVGQRELGWYTERLV